MLDPAAYVTALQGRPWSPDWHCWDLVRDVQRDLFGRELPPVLIEDRLSARELVRAFHGHPERARWQEVAGPVNGAVVLMHRPGSHARAIHAGVYLDLDGGGVLHADEEAGVTFDSLLDLNLRNWRCEFFLLAAEGEGAPMPPCGSTGVVAKASRVAIPTHSATASRSRPRAKP